MKRAFSKPALSIADQIALLESRGMEVPDKTLAHHSLQHISYYRLRAYWLYYETATKTGTHGFAAGTAFESVLALYDFDRRLRLAVMDGVERIEVAARGAWAHHLAMKHGPHGYADAALYPNKALFARNLKQLQDEIGRSHDTFIEHYRATYDRPPLPPVWMASELVSFGLLSKFMTTLGARADRQAIARTFGLDERVYIKFLHHLATVRNVCAHHGRLWNKGLTVTATLPRQPSDLAASINAGRPRHLYNTLTIMLHLMRVVSPSSDWKKRLASLLDENPTQDFVAIGFPPDWRDRPLWKA